MTGRADVMMGGAEVTTRRANATTGRANCLWESECDDGESRCDDGGTGSDDGESECDDRERIAFPAIMFSLSPGCCGHSPSCHNTKILESTGGISLPVGTLALGCFETHRSGTFPKNGLVACSAEVPEAARIAGAADMSSDVAI